MLHFSTPFSEILEALAFPPGNALVLAVAALLLRRGLRRVLIGAAFVLLYVQSAPLTVQMFIAPLERYPPLALDKVPTADAIVVLGGGRYRDAPEYGYDSASDLTLARLQYAADLARVSGLPLVVSGGSVEAEPATEASIMAGTLRRTFGINNEILTEDRSRNTAQNAFYTKELLDMRGWRRVLLVTHARDMPRALAMFEKIGVEVVPAPAHFEAQAHAGALQLSDLLPSAKAMYQFRLAAHEYVGLVWYRMRY